MESKYLPSKEFRLRLMVLVVFVVVVFGIYELVHFIRTRIHSGKQQAPLVVKDVVQKDSNANGIADWEETLWGLDPTKNGPSNKEFIVARQQTLAQTNAATGTIPTGTSAENEILSKQFFATIMALQQSGDLTDSSLQAVVDSVGKQIQAKPIPDIYTNAMFKTVPATQTSVITYLKAVKDLLLKYKDSNIGDELSFIATALKNNDANALKATADAGLAYRAFGKDLTRIPVPDVALSLTLSLANDYEKTGQSIEGLTHILTDPLIGMQALINYRKYNDELVNNLGILSDF